MVDKEPFDIDAAITAIREAVRSYPPAAMFQLAEEGYGSLFEQLVACMISIRTRDEESLPIAKRLFDRARTPEAIAKLQVGEIASLIEGSSFAHAKATDIASIAKQAVESYAGELPCDEGVLTSFRGVGPKCAHLALGIACGQERISVDIHVYRVVNRWGYVFARTPEGTMTALEATLPKRYWIEINRLLVPFGKHVCRGSHPRCSQCPVVSMCRQVGVTAPS